ncbi:helix-turn-helix domain-containing protein [Sessilibacter sp. MAH4]
MTESPTSATPKEKVFSRSAMADALGVSLKEVTEVLIKSGWLTQQGDQWHLTAKGEFEGGQVRHSKKFGDYIVWPESALTHPIFRFDKDETLKASDIAKEVGLSGRLVNLLLQHCGWLKREHKGWTLTPLGASVGGIQHENAKTGVPWCSWPKSLLAQDYFQQACVNLTNIEIKPHLCSLNGIDVKSPQAAAFLSWCYLTGVVVAQNIAHPARASLIFDFYLPRVGLFIDIWSTSLTPTQLAARLERKTVCEELEIDYIVFEEVNILQLEQDLPRELLKRDLEVL